MTESELLYIQMLANLAIIECHFNARPFCIFNHPEFPGERWEIGRTYVVPWPTPLPGSNYLH